MATVAHIAENPIVAESNRYVERRTLLTSIACAGDEIAMRALCTVQQSSQEFK